MVGEPGHRPAHDDRRRAGQQTHEAAAGGPQLHRHPLPRPRRQRERRPVGKSNPSISGASGLENNYIVDGVNITNAGYGGVGSYSIVFGSLGTGVTQDFIKETQVKTGGFEAEYGQSTGGVVNVVTQSGTNALHGALSATSGPAASSRAGRTLQTPNGTVNTTAADNYDFGVTLGGPLVKDKLFFFGAFNPQYQTRTFVAPRRIPAREPGERRPQAAHPLLRGEGDVAGELQPPVRVSLFGDPSHGDNGPQRGTALTATTTSQFSDLKKYGGHNQVGPVRRDHQPELVRRGVVGPLEEHDQRDPLRRTPGASPIRP